jgi:hypothetical protein
VTPDALGALLESFSRTCAEESLSRAGCRPRSSPSPPIDARFSDLFRLDALAAVRTDNGLEPWAASRWRDFIAAGVGRRAGAELRREVDRLLARADEVAAVDEPSASVEAGRLRGAAAERAAESLRLEAAAGERCRSTDPGSGSERRGTASGDERLLWRRLTPEHDGAPLNEPGEERAVTDVLVAGGTRDLWRALVSAGGLLRPGDGSVETRAAAVTGAFAVETPGHVVLLDRGAAGLAAYEEFLAAAGEALAWSHLPSRLPVWDRRLPGEGGARLFGRLLALRLADPVWLEAKGVTGTRAARLARLALDRWHSRLATLARRALVEQALVAPEETVAADAPARDAALDRICGGQPAAEALQAERLAIAWDELLRVRFGRRWDENRRAVGLLREIWSVGWGRPPDELLLSFGVRDPDGEQLLERMRAARRES